MLCCDLCLRCHCGHISQQLFAGVNATESKGSYVYNDTTAGARCSLSSLLGEKINRHVILQHPVGAPKAIIFNLRHIKICRFGL
jgi:hypothetical protein